MGCSVEYDVDVDAMQGSGRIDLLELAIVASAQKGDYLLRPRFWRYRNVYSYTAQLMRACCVAERLRDAVQSTRARCVLRIGNV